MLVAERCLSGQQSTVGTLLMDAPKHHSGRGLVELAENKQDWNMMCNLMCPKRDEVQRKLGAFTSHIIKCAKEWIDQHYRVT